MHICAYVQLPSCFLQSTWRHSIFSTINSRLPTEPAEGNLEISQCRPTAKHRVNVENSETRAAKQRNFDRAQPAQAEALFTQHRVGTTSVGGHSTTRHFLARTHTPTQVDSPCFRTESEQCRAELPKRTPPQHCPTFLATCWNRIPTNRSLTTRPPKAAAVHV